MDVEQYKQIQNFVKNVTFVLALIKKITGSELNVQQARLVIFCIGLQSHHYLTILLTHKSYHSAEM